MGGMPVFHPKWMKNITSTWLSPVSEPTVGSGVLIVPPYLINYGLKKCLGDGAWEQVFLSLAFSASAKAPRCHFPPSPSAASSAHLIATAIFTVDLWRPRWGLTLPQQTGRAEGTGAALWDGPRQPDNGSCSTVSSGFLTFHCKKNVLPFHHWTIQVLFITSICCASIWLTLIS